MKVNDYAKTQIAQYFFALNQGGLNRQ
jgi:hypothetical protein